MEYDIGYHTPMYVCQPCKLIVSLCFAKVLDEVNPNSSLISLAILQNKLLWVDKFYAQGPCSTKMILLMNWGFQVFGAFSKIAICSDTALYLVHPTPFVIFQIIF